MTKTVNWGIIGCGNVTEVKSGPAFSKVKNSRLVAVMRRSAEKSKDYALRHNVPRWYDNADDLINDPGVNAVYIATPPGSHAEYAIQAMQAGKAAYVEKPMAEDYSRCLDMIRVSEETGMPLFVAYYRRMLPGFLKIKEIIDSGVIGNPLFFSIRLFTPPLGDDFDQPLPWRVIPSISGGGYIYDLGSHQLDFIDYLFGPVERVSSLTLNIAGLYEPEDFISAGFSCRGNIAGNGVWYFTAPEHMKEEVIEISGEKGKIKFSCFDFSPISLTLDKKTTQIENHRPEHVQYPFIQSVVEELLGKGKCPGSALSAARTSKLLDQIVNKI